jgi:Concanavalin A-like lectin/glucanases superfamily
VILGRRAGAALGAVAIALAGCFPTFVFPGDTDGGAADASGDAGTDAGRDATVDDGAPQDDAGYDAPLDTGRDARVDGGDAGPVVSLQNCVLLLHMDEPSWPDAGAVRDTSGAGNHGSPVGTATTTTQGKFGGAGTFDGSGWVGVPDSVSLHATTAVTYAAWVYPTGLTDGTPSPGVISKRHGFGDMVAFTLFLWTSNQAWVDLQATRFNSNAVFVNNAWAHIAVVYDGLASDTAQRGRLYVNGTLDKTSSADPVLSSNVEDVLVGNLPGGGNTFIGRIDEVVIWTRALSAAEISALAQATGPL